MYHKLLESLITYHNDEVLYQKLSSLIIPMRSRSYYDQMNALVINDSNGNINVFKMSILSYYGHNVDHETQLKKWIEMRTVSNGDNKIRLGNSVSYSQCHYCGYKADILNIENSVLILCKECLLNRKMVKLGEFHVKFPIRFNQVNYCIKSWYNIDDISLNIWYGVGCVFYHLSFIFSNKLSSIETSPLGCDTSSFGRCFNLCYSCCDGHYPRYKCDQCIKILICRNTMIQKFLAEKLLWIKQWNMVADIRTCICQFLIILCYC